MGWFNNTPTAGRVNNSIQLLAVAVTMGASKNQLDNVNTFIDSQRQRAQNLAGQAFSVQGANSALGRELQSAINELGSCLVSGREVSEDLQSRIETMNFIITQFDVPRVSRRLNMSGHQMTSVATASALEVRENIELLRDRFAGPVGEALTTADRADRELNGSRSMVARDAVPRLD